MRSSYMTHDELKEINELNNFCKIGSKFNYRGIEFLVKNNTILCTREMVGKLGFEKYDKPCLVCEFVNELKELKTHIFYIEDLPFLINEVTNNKVLLRNPDRPIKPPPPPAPPRIIKEGFFTK